MKKGVIVAFLLVVMPLQAMFSRTSKVPRTKPTKAVRAKTSEKSARYQKAAATQQYLMKRAQIHQQSETSKAQDVSVPKEFTLKSFEPEQGMALFTPIPRTEEKASTSSSFLQPIEPIKQEVIPQQTIKFENKEPRFKQTQIHAKGMSFGALLAALGLGWLWSSSEDEDEEKESQAAEEKYVTLEEFVKRFAPPKNIQETIEAHKDAISPKK